LGKTAVSVNILPMNWKHWETQFTHFISSQMAADAAHDLAHIQRVVANARHLAQLENAEMAVVLPAAWLHDCVTVPKDSPQRAQASRLAAEKAGHFLQTAGYPAQFIPLIAHAIAAHSFSANIPPETIEAKVVQDADRLDALGAVGMARTFMVGGALKRPLYHPADPFCQRRQPDDAVSTVDHFYTKLFTLPKTMQTEAGRAEAEARAAFMRAFLRQLGHEIGVADKVEPVV